MICNIVEGMHHQVIIMHRRKAVQGNGGRGGNRRNRRETAVDEGRKEMADRVARYQAD